MLGKTHIVTASSIATIPFLINSNINISAYVILYAGILIGSILPDIDEPHSLIGSKLSFISYQINIVFGHRTITHNIFIGIIISIIGLLLNINIIIGIGLGIIIHILSDSITKGGINGGLFPLTSNNTKFVLLPYSLRFKVGGIVELCILILLSIYQVYFFTIIL